MYEDILKDITMLLTSDSSDTMDKFFEYILNKKLYFFSESERKRLKYEIEDLLIQKLKYSFPDNKLFLIAKNLFPNIVSFMANFSDSEKYSLLIHYKSVLSAEEIKNIILCIKDKRLLNLAVKHILEFSITHNSEDFSKKDLNKYNEFNSKNIIKVDKDYTFYNYKSKNDKKGLFYTTNKELINTYEKKTKRTITPEIEKNTPTIFAYLYKNNPNISDLLNEFIAGLSEKQLLALCFSNINEILILDILEKVKKLEINYLLLFFSLNNFNYLIEKSDDIAKKIIEIIGVKNVLKVYTGVNGDTYKIILEAIQTLPTKDYLSHLIYVKDKEFIKSKLLHFKITKEEVIECLHDNVETEEFILAIADVYGVDVFRNYSGRFNIGIQYSIISNLNEEFFSNLSLKEQSDIFSAYRLVDNKNIFFKLLSEEKYYNFYKMTGINILQFIKYCNDFYILSYLIEIIDNHISQFEELYDKLKKYIKEEKLYGIPLLADIIRFYHFYPKLSFRINLSKNLNVREIKNIYRLLKSKEVFDINNLEELNSLDEYIDEEIHNAINNPDITIKELKNIFLKNFTNKNFQEFGNILSYGINSKTLKKILAKKDSMSEEEYFKVGNLDVFISFITEVYALESKEKLKAALKLIDTPEKRERYSRIINYFNDIFEKIREVYEIDANITLTNLSELPDELFDKEYGYYDLSNCEYGLYTHSTELKYLNDLVEPRYSGFSYICLSGISDKMRKGNYHGDIIVLYDHIPKGGFIASSPFNLSSRYRVYSNSYDMSGLSYVQMEFKDNTFYRIADKSSHSETNIYREGLLPAGILVKGDIPSEEELEAQKILSDLLNRKVPLIKVQDKYHTIENPLKIESFRKPKQHSDISSLSFLRNELLELKDIIGKDRLIENSTKRKIGILTDIHGLDVPLKVVLEDMKRKGITEIYSLGDNFEDGPNPKEVMRLLEEYNVISLAGNAEEYITLGTEPFNYLTSSRKENILWTEKELSDSDKEKISKYPHSIELILGGKRIGLCHFATDVRTEFRGVWDYQDNIKRGSAYLQFSQTNSGNESEGKNNAYESRKREPLFNGKKVDLYDAIIQGHTHFKITEQSPHTKFYTLRANGMGYGNDSSNTASYVILEETENGYDLEEILVPFDRIKLAESILSSTLPDKEKIIKFTGLTEEEIRIAKENLGFGTNGRK